MVHSAYANRFLNLVTAQSLSLDGTGKCYLGLSSTKPNFDGTNFSEPTTSDYERIQTAINIKEENVLTYTNMWGAPAGGRVENKKEFTSRECKQEGGWTPGFRYFGLFDAPTGGNLMVSGALRDPDGEINPATGLKPKTVLNVGKNQVAVFRVGTLVLDFNELELSEELDPEAPDETVEPTE